MNALLKQAEQPLPRRPGVAQTGSGPAHQAEIEICLSDLNQATDQLETVLATLEQALASVLVEDTPSIPREAKARHTKLGSSISIQIERICSATDFVTKLTSRLAI